MRGSGSGGGFDCNDGVGGDGGACGGGGTSGGGEDDR